MRMRISDTPLSPPKGMAYAMVCDWHKIAGIHAGHGIAAKHTALRSPLMPPQRLTRRVHYAPFFVADSAGGAAGAARR